MIAIPIHSRRRARAQFLQKLQHALPSVILLMDGLERLGRGDRGESAILGAAEIIVSGLVIVSMVRTARKLRAPASDPSAHARPHAHGVDWVDILLGVMLFVEAFMHRHETGHLPRPTIMLATTLVVIGVLHEKLTRVVSRRHALRITDDAISVPGRFFTRLTVPWKNVAEIAIEEGVARVIALDGRRQHINLGDTINAAEIRDALLAARGRLSAVDNRDGANGGGRGAPPFDRQHTHDK